MERLTKYICDHAHGAEGVRDDALTGSYCRGEFEATAIVNRLAAIEDILGDEYDLDRLRELSQADRDGRCVVLPCKPSDVTIYQLRNKKHARGVGISPRHISCATVWADGSYALHHQGQDDCLDRDFSKTWFLTREEADAALRREQE